MEYIKRLSALRVSQNYGRFFTWNEHIAMSECGSKYFIAITAGPANSYRHFRKI